MYKINRKDPSSKTVQKTVSKKECKNTNQIWQNGNGKFQKNPENLVRFITIQTDDKRANKITNTKLLAPRLT